MADALTRDIPLPNESGQIDPRLQTRPAQLARQRARSGREPDAPPTPTKAMSAAKSVVPNWRSFTKGRSVTR